MTPAPHVTLSGSYGLSTASAQGWGGGRGGTFPTKGQGPRDPRQRRTGDGLAAQEAYLHQRGATSGRKRKSSGFSMIRSALESWEATSLLEGESPPSDLLQEDAEVVEPQDNLSVWEPESDNGSSEHPFQEEEEKEEEAGKEEEKVKKEHPGGDEVYSSTGLLSFLDHFIFQIKESKHQETEWAKIKSFIEKSRLKKAKDWFKIRNIVSSSMRTELLFFFVITASFIPLAKRSRAGQLSSLPSVPFCLAISCERAGG
ncbi:uncharacterized protein LOC126067332 [Elephas maximus indicus]|uniref:uncharacterized protein LOC126067332 n=1 Tax=Elephas maximus indicus TaxID=99487 RepID=UPI0021165D56|nr:uncharacterized protein LOC126067332 [Elephas maximus indicus]